MALDLHGAWSRRPWWANLLLAFCAWMTLVYVPWDLFWKPVAEDVDVWFGIALTGWAAKAGALAHWIVYGALGWGLWRVAPWVWPVFSLYAAQVAFSMLVWNVAAERGFGWGGGVISALPFAALAAFLWRHGMVGGPPRDRPAEGAA